MAFADAKISLGTSFGANVEDIGCKAPGDVCGAVRGRIIHHNDFGLLIGLTLHTQEAAGDICFFIFRGDNDRNKSHVRRPSFFWCV